jgi:superkiller protein 3
LRAVTDNAFYVKADTEKALSVAQGALFAEPAQMEVRNELARLMVQGGEWAVAGAVLAGVGSGGDLKVVPVSLGLRAVARTLEGSGEKEEDEETGLRETQRAIMLSPSSIRGWQALAYIRSTAGS